MRVFIIPDVHLKPWMFAKAEHFMQKYEISQAVALGDIPDDFKKKNDVKLVSQTFDAAESFLQKHPNTLWCIGNHEASYLWNAWQSGQAYRAKRVTAKRILALYHQIENVNANHLAYVFRLDRVLFSHAGICNQFLEKVPNLPRDIDDVIACVNDLQKEQMWTSLSPLWLRPQNLSSYANVTLWHKEDLFQVVGHTPMTKITQEGNLISCDTFSLKQDRTPYGDQTFLIIDTETGKWEKILCS